MTDPPPPSIDNYSSSSSKKESYSVLQIPRRLGLPSSTFFIMGNIIGSGIFVSPKGVLENSGSVGLSLILWMIGGFVITLGALCYIELGTVLEKSGGEYTYLRQGFGTVSPRAGEVLGSMSIFASVLIIQPAACAIQALAFALYLIQPFYPSCADETVLVKLLAAVAICLIVVINYYSVRAAARVQIIFTITKISALIVIIIGGIINLAQGKSTYLHNVFHGSTHSAGDLARALYNSMWSYGGWQVLNYVTEEVVNPKVTLPLALLIAVPSVTILYILTNLSYMSLLSTQEFLASDAVAVTWGSKMLGKYVVVIPIFVAISTFGACNSTMFSTTRLTNTAARDGVLAKCLSYVHISRFTPAPAILFMGFISLIMIIPGNISSLLELQAFVEWTYITLCAVVLLILRKTRPLVARPIKPFLPIPLLFLAFSAFLVIAPIVDHPTWKTLYGVILLFSGLLLYFPFVYLQLKVPYIDKITAIMQVLLFVAPCGDSNQ